MFTLVGSPRSAANQLIAYLEERGILDDPMAVNSKRLLLQRLALARFVRENAQSNIPVPSSTRTDRSSEVSRDTRLSFTARERQAIRIGAGGHCEKRCACGETPKERLGAVQDDSLGGSAP